MGEEPVCILDKRTIEALQFVNAHNSQSICQSILAVPKYLLLYLRANAKPLKMAVRCFAIRLIW